MNGGVDPTKAVDSFLGGLGISQEVIPGLRDDLIRDARNKPKPPNMEARLKLQANEQMRLDLETQKAFEEAERGGRPLSRSRRREFERQSKDLNLEAAILRHQARQEELQEKNLREQEKSSMSLENIEKQLRESKGMPGSGGNR